MMNLNKRWVIAVLITILIMFVVLGGSTVIIDPYFHYHKPLDGLAYTIGDERYQNDGIVKHFNYDAIITGTSMTENFKASEFDELFNVHSIKVPFNGGSLKEINSNLVVATEYNSQISIILRGLDSKALFDSADALRENLPVFLYDNNLFNDVKYIFNASILCETLSVIVDTIEGKETNNFDDYAYWASYREFGKEIVDARYKRLEKKEKKTDISKEDYKNITENIRKNVTELVEKHPEIDFYLFFPPYSIYFWDSLNQSGYMERQLDGEKYAIELLLQYENIHLFSFFTEYDTICNLDNYMDASHYSADINSQILVWMKDGKHELTLDNYENYYSEIKKFYMNYDYDSLFDETMK